MEVRLRPGIADPQGATVERALPALGFDAVHRVRVGKAIHFEVDAADEQGARAVTADLAGRLLSNPVIEDTEVLVCRPVDGATVASGAVAGAHDVHTEAGSGGRP